jgi:hypothetical protein
MVPTDEPLATSLIGRREAIRRAALLAGVALSPALAHGGRPRLRRGSAGTQASQTAARDRV